MYEKGREMITNALEVLCSTSEQSPGPRAFSLGDGDCGIVIRADGRNEMFSQGIDTEALRKPYATMSSGHKQALLNGQTLMVLGIVANSPELQQVILSYAVNEGVVDVPAANSNG